jgi:hypothetical protein
VGIMPTPDFVGQKKPNFHAKKDKKELNAKNILIKQTSSSDMC